MNKNFCLHLVTFGENFRRRKDQVLTRILRPLFRKIGSHVSFQFPLNIEGHQYIEIGDNSFFNRHATITAVEERFEQCFSPNLRIGANCSFGEYCHITCVESILIGNNLLTGRWVTITDNSHGETNLENLQIAPMNRKVFSPGPVIIGENVWIGDKSTILPNVKIGNGVVIAANSVVTKDVPDFAVVAGIPAIVIKQNEI